MGKWCKARAECVEKVTDHPISSQGCDSGQCYEPMRFSNLILSMELELASFTFEQLPHNLSAHLICCGTFNIMCTSHENYHLLIRVSVFLLTRHSKLNFFWPLKDTAALFNLSFKMHLSKIPPT